MEPSITVKHDKRRAGQIGPESGRVSGGLQCLTLLTSLTLGTGQKHYLRSGGFWIFIRKILMSPSQIGRIWVHTSKDWQNMGPPPPPPTDIYIIFNKPLMCSVALFELFQFC